MTTTDGIMDSMSHMADALIPPYNVDVIAPQVLANLGHGATYDQVWDLLIEYGLNPWEHSWDVVFDAALRLVRSG